MRRTRAELDHLVTQLIGYLSYRNPQGDQLPVRDLAKLLDISKSRAAQLTSELAAGRYSHLKNATGTKKSPEGAQ